MFNVIQAFWSLQTPAKDKKSGGCSELRREGKGDKYVMISFTVDRTSVCMGDDTESHKIECTVSEDADLAALFEKLKSVGFFPSIQGNNVVWVLTSGNNCVFSYFTKTERVFPDIPGRKISEILTPCNHLYFSYCTSPANWKKYILKISDVEVRSEEIEHCDFLTEEKENE